MGSPTEWTNLVTLDYNADHNPDVIWDLNRRPLPFDDDSFDECHAYEVLEHLGRQGDYHAFFEEWSEWWRILKPGGLFFATCPHWSSKWAWGDPSHTRIVSVDSLIFLNQPAYTAQVGKTPMSDFRHIYKADFDIIHAHVLRHEIDNATQEFCLRAIKPSRIKF